MRGDMIRVTRECCGSDKRYWQVADHPATAVRVCLQGRLRLKEVVVIVVILEGQADFGWKNMELTSRSVAANVALARVERDG
jgi:hypothetical protein